MDDATRLPVKAEKWNRVFDNFLSTPDFPLRRALELEVPWQREMNWGVAPVFDVAEKDKEYQITAKLPGMDEQNIEIRLSNRTLAITGEKENENAEHEMDHHLSERRYSSFMRSFRLPEGVDTGKIEASFAKGVLTVKLPKMAEGWFSAIVIGALLVTGLVAHVS